MFRERFEKKKSETRSVEAHNARIKEEREQIQMKLTAMITSRTVKTEKLFAVKARELQLCDSHQELQTTNSTEPQQNQTNRH
jgi:hypothetical protein